MYAKNNFNPLNKLHSNALMKSQSPQGFKSKPLSEIQNSLQKLKARKRKSKSKSKSKQNTPEEEGSFKRRTSINNKKNSIYLHSLQQKKKQTRSPIIPKKSATNFTQHINSFIQSYQKPPIKISSQININSRVLTDSNATSSVRSEYQLPISSQISQKSVKFSDKNIQFNINKINSKRDTEKTDKRQKTPSILKKKLSLNSVNSQRSSSSVKSSTKVSRTKDLVDMQNLSGNKIIKSKYQSLIKKFQDLNKRFGKNQLKNYPKLQKYTDDIFPPQNSSIYSYSIHNKSEKPKNLEWKRIPQLYTDHELVVLREQKSKSLIKITKNVYNKDCNFVQDYVVTSFNCIRQNTTLLSKIFQFKSVNLSGIYIVKIFQQNSWKYVILDDYIPVLYNQLKDCYTPAFINVQKAEGNTSQTIQIWPYLLQKAYAVYYSKYQALKFGNQKDFLEQLTGVPANQIKIKLNGQNKSQFMQIENLLRQERGVVLGQKINGQKSSYYSILPDLNSITKKAQGFCAYLTLQKNYKPIKQKIQILMNNLNKIYIFYLDVPTNICSSFLCPQNKKSSQGSFRYKNKNQLANQVIQDRQISLRCFTLNETTNTILHIKQKDKKFYFQGKVQYSYIWVRAILLIKQHNQDYRWVDGIYSNSKSISIFKKLQRGQYYLLLMPQWSQSFKYDISINLYTENGTTVIQKKPYEQYSQIFEKGCADIAQRQGQMNQINKYICAYNYVSEVTGLVVQNINNERQNGPVTVMRSINGLKCQVSLVPVNKQFYHISNSQYQNQIGRKLKKTIEVDIEANQHYTVVLKTIGGIDHKFFQSFDFGC